MHFGSLLNPKSKDENIGIECIEVPENDRLAGGTLIGSLHLAGSPSSTESSHGMSFARAREPSTLGLVRGDVRARGVLGRKENHAHVRKPCGGAVLRISLPFGLPQLHRDGRCTFGYAKYS